MKDLLKAVAVVTGFLFMLLLWLGPPVALIYIVLHFVRKFW